MHSSAHYRQLLTRLPQIAVAADQFQVLSSAKDFKSRILSLIAHATQRIYLIALYLQDDEAAALRKSADAVQNLVDTMKGFDA